MQVLWALSLLCHTIPPGEGGGADSWWCADGQAVADLGRYFPRLCPGLRCQFGSDCNGFLGARTVKIDASPCKADIPKARNALTEVAESTNYWKGSFLNLLQQRGPFDEHVPPLHGQVFQPSNLAEQLRRKDHRERQKSSGPDETVTTETARCDFKQVQRSLLKNAINHL